jgi:hypothetical protein
MLYILQRMNRNKKADEVYPSNEPGKIRTAILENCLEKQSRIM